MPDELQIDEEEVDQMWLVAFDDDEVWCPSDSAGLFFSYKAARAFVDMHLRQREEDALASHQDWTILRVLPFQLRVVNDFNDPLNPPPEKT